MIYCNMKKNHSKEQQNVKQKSQLRISESKGSANEMEKALNSFYFCRLAYSCFFKRFFLFVLVFICVGTLSVR